MACCVLWQGLLVIPTLNEKNVRGAFSFEVHSDTAGTDGTEGQAGRQAGLYICLRLQVGEI